MSNPREIKSVSMRATSEYIKKYSDQPAQLCDEFVPFIEELLKAVGEMKAGDEILIQASFVPKERKPIYSPASNN